MEIKTKVLLSFTRRDLEKSLETFLNEVYTDERYVQRHRELVDVSFSFTYVPGLGGRAYCALVLYRNVTCS
jgi:hypothetical protein